MMKNFLFEILYEISPRFVTSIIYYRHRGRFPDFIKPKGLSEFILSQILTGEVNCYSKYVDKVSVRGFLSEIGLSCYLPKLYGVWDDPLKIDFASLPESFALKTNHGCGSHYFRSPNSELDEQLAISTIKKALKTNFGIVESQYGQIKPLCFAEEFINDTRGSGLPLDYKFMCFDGKIKCVLLCSERGSGTKLSTYDINWEPLNWIKESSKSLINFKKPLNFEEMKSIVERIAVHFPQVRVDLYSLSSGKIYIGELTFTPQGGFMRYFTNEADKLLIL